MLTVGEMEKRDTAEAINNGYRKGRETREAYLAGTPDAKKKAHEERAKKSGLNALTEYFRTQVYGYRSGRTTTNSLTLGDYLLETSTEFLASHYDEPVERLLQSVDLCKKKAVALGRRSSGIVLLIVSVVFSALEIATTKGLTNFNYPIALFILFAGILLSARSIRLKIIDKSSSAPVEKMEKMVDVVGAPPLPKVIIVIMCIIFLGSLGYSGYRVFPMSQNQSVRQALEDNKTDTQLEEALDLVLLSDGQMTEAGINVLRKVYESKKVGSIDALRIALYAVNRTGKGYPEAQGREMLDEQIEKLDYSQFADGDQDHAELLEKALSKYGGKAERVISQFTQTGSKSDASTVAVLGTYWKDKAYQETEDIGKTLRYTGFQADRFFSTALNEKDLPSFLNFLLAEDQENMIADARAYGEACTSLENAIPIVYAFRNKGMALSDIFPNGITIQYDLSKINVDVTTFDSCRMPEGDRYVVLSRTEHDVPFGKKENDKGDPDTFTTRLESQCMDQIPIEHLPKTIDECDIVLVADMEFQHWGNVTIHYDMTHNSNDYPIQSRIYRILAVEYRDTIWAYTAKINQVDPFFTPKRDEPEKLLKELRDTYLASEKHGWQKNEMMSFLKELEDLNWSNTAMMNKIQDEQQ